MSPIAIDHLEQLLQQADSDLVYSGRPSLGAAARCLAQRRKHRRRLGSIAGGTALTMIGLVALGMFLRHADQHDPTGASVAGATTVAETAPTAHALALREVRRLDTDYLQRDSAVFHLQRIRAGLSTGDPNPLAARAMAAASNRRQANQAAQAWLLCIADPARTDPLDEGQRNKLGNLIAVFPQTMAAETARKLVAQH